MKTVLTVLGARPQFIKAATVSRLLSDVRGVREILVHTGQHYDANMSSIFFDELELPKPDHHLGIAGGSHGQMTGRMLEKLESVLELEKPDAVLVYGDTNSTLSGALAAAKMGIDVVHVEAGLRSYNRSMPEEINRVLTDHVATLLMTPTDTASANLEREGVPEERIHQVGDVMFDAALFYGEKAEAESDVLSTWSLARNEYCLATIHRQENTDDSVRLSWIMDGLEELARHIKVVLPLHPRTRSRLSNHGLLPRLEKLLVLPPLGYLDMVMLERGAAVVVTDSGGVQKEAYFHGVPCVTVRDETEWVELIDSDWNLLAPPGTSNLAGIVASRIGHAGIDARPYGDGDSASRIVELITG